MTMKLFLVKFRLLDIRPPYRVLIAVFANDEEEAYEILLDKEYHLYDYDDNKQIMRDAVYEAIYFEVEGDHEAGVVIDLETGSW